MVQIVLGKPSKNILTFVELNPNSFFESAFFHFHVLLIVFMQQ